MGGCSVTVTLKIGSSLNNGFSRVANRNGAVLTLAYVRLGLIWQVAFYNLFVMWVQMTNPELTAVPLPVIDVPLAISAVVATVPAAPCCGGVCYQCRDVRLRRELRARQIQHDGLSPVARFDAAEFVADAKCPRW